MDMLQAHIDHTEAEIARLKRLIARPDYDVLAHLDQEAHYAPLDLWQLERYLEQLKADKLKRSEG